MVGKKLSHYKILAELGRGGMGIVYKAEDTKLDRTVAIKVLPSAALGSEDDRARFYREAKAAAQLHHPHIASVFEIDEAVPEGSNSDDLRPFIAMEFIEGETLEDRVAKGPVKISDCVRIATEIASGLKAAHDKGIVHRDIKAANVILDSNGGAKILDFGLAQTAKSTKLTRMGSTLGTVAFMSPEQARGEEVDQRSDLWSLGVVLYEMVSGQSPFPGDYEQAVVYEILNQDPEPLTALRTGVPMELEAVVAKCLSKNTELRYPSAEGLIVDLKRIDSNSAVRTSHLGSRVSGPVQAVAPAIAVEKPSSKTTLLIAGGVGVAALIIGLAVGGLSMDSDPEPRAVIKTQLILPNAFSPLHAVVTPDDRSLFYVLNDPSDGTRRLGRYDFQTGEREIIGRTDNASRPAVSQDGRWIVYQNTQSGEMWKLLASGGEPILVPGSKQPGGGGPEFNLNNDVIISDSSWSIVSIASDGSRTMLYESGQEGLASVIAGHRSSPEGTFITFSGWAAGSTPANAWILKTGETEPKLLMPSSYITNFTASGHALMSSGSQNVPQQTVAVPIDLTTGEILGDGVALGVWSQRKAISPSGLLVYEELSTEGIGEIPSQLYKISSNGSKELLLTLPGQSSQEIAVASDGTKLAVNAGDNDSGQSDIYLVDLVLGTNTRLTQGGGYDVPSWGGTDNILYFDYNLGGIEWTIMRRRADGAGTNERVLPEGVMGGGDPDITPDNSLMVYSSDTDDIWAYDMVADSAFVVVEDNLIQYKPDISPDGKYVVYVHDGDSYCGSVQVAAIQGFSEPIEISERGCYPVWTLDGKYIYFQDARTISRIPVSSDPVFRQLGPAEEVYSISNNRRVGTPGSLYFDVSQDGTLYVSHSQVTEGNTNLIWVVTNWFEELNQIAPRSD